MQQGLLTGSVSACSRVFRHCLQRYTAARFIVALRLQWHVGRPGVDKNFESAGGEERGWGGSLLPACAGELCVHQQLHLWHGRQVFSPLAQLAWRQVCW
jgi:hypothetical protein